MTKSKTVKIGNLVKKDGKYVYEILSIVREFDPIFRKWVDKDKQTSYETLEERGCTKVVELEVIFAKQAENWTGFGQPPTNFFLQKVRFSIPKERKYQNYWLKLTENKRVVCSVLPSHAFEVDFLSEFVKTITKPKRISKKKARELLQSKAVYPRILQKFGDGFRVIVYNVQM